MLREQRIQDLVIKYDYDNRDASSSRDSSLLAVADKDRLRYLEQVVSKQAKDIYEKDSEIRRLQSNLQEQDRLEPTVQFSHLMGTHWSGQGDDNGDAVSQLRLELDDASHQVCTLAVSYSQTESSKSSAC
jgi:hypothetical protein